MQPRLAMHSLIPASASQMLGVLGVCTEQENKPVNLDLETRL